MHLTTYPIIEKADDLSEFKFISSGPKGELVKFIVFEKLLYGDIYNIALLDVDENGMLTDSSFSNNNDLRKILATTVMVILEYTDVFPERTIFLGSSDELGRRIEVYKRAIVQYYPIFQEILTIDGVTIDGRAEVFNAMGTYVAFLVKRK